MAETGACANCKTNSLYVLEKTEDNFKIKKKCESYKTPQQLYEAAAQYFAQFTTKES